MRTRSKKPRRAAQRQLLQAIGRDVPRFQEASYAFDDVAARVLAVPRADLPYLTMLLFAGPASAGELAAALHAPLGTAAATLERLQLAGYARYQPGDDGRIELTDHARTWIRRIWDPRRREGDRLLGGYSTSHLSAIASFLRQACEVQESRTSRLRAWLALPSSPARRPHLRGGLSPAALRRVQVFVEANLGGVIQLPDLAARAALSPYHFARAFKRSAGMTPRAFVEHRRIERAKRMLVSSKEPIAAIAVDTGFVTQSRLTTAFRRQTGFTPAAFRRGIHT